MTTSTLTIADFLLARVAEDEVVAREAFNAYPPDEPLPAMLGEHIARHDPARVLAECAAKRAVVALAWAYGDGPEHPRTLALAADTLRHLATAYADHPDYDERWRP